MRSQPEDPGPSYPAYTPPTAPTPAPSAAPVEPVTPSATPSPAAAKAKPKTTRRRPAAKRRGKKRPDQLVRVLQLLTNGGGWMSAKELSDAGGAAGTPILPGNVRKVIRARGDVVIETRPREGSRRGALEYRITAAGTQRLSEASS